MSSTYHDKGPGYPRQEASQPLQPPPPPHQQPYPSTTVGAYPPMQATPYPPPATAPYGAQPPPGVATGGMPPPYAATQPMGAPYGSQAMYAPTSTNLAVTAARHVPEHSVAMGETSADDSPFGDSFSEKAVRLAFVKKVFAIVSLMLIVTIGVMCLFMFVEDLRNYVQENIWVYITSICVYMALTIILVCVGDIRRKTPHSYIFLGLITLAVGVMLGTIASYFETKEVLIAAAITVLVTVGMCALGFQNKIDFTMLYGALMAGTLCLIGFSIFAIIFQSEVLYMFYAALGAFLFSLWIVFDVQLMMGGKHKFAISPEEYAVAALNLYLDIIQLFMYLLMIVAGSNN